MKKEKYKLTQKNSKSKQWFKDKADKIDSRHYTTIYDSGEVTEDKRMEVNYNLFNNVLNLKDLDYVCKPFGDDVGELPATMRNVDITSGKIKYILGTEMKKAFPYKIIAVNTEATTRKEKEEYERLKNYVVNQIIQPVREQIELKYQEELKGKNLTKEESSQIQQQIEEELKAQTPKRVKKYMLREHQDPGEILYHQLAEYLKRKCNLKMKFNNVFKHGLLSGKEVMYVGILNKEPEVWVVNSRDFNSNKSNTDFIEDREEASCIYRMTPSQISKYFGDELKEKEIKKIYQYCEDHNIAYNEGDLFSYEERQSNYESSSYIQVIHTVWKDLREVYFLTYGENEKMIVDENYELNKDMGDISLEKEFIPETYETWKIKLETPIYVNMRPIPGQLKDLDDLYTTKLPYYGVEYDDMNSKTTSLMDRLKIFQYYYNIIMYKVELLMASDEGKKVMMNINAVPDELGVKLFKYFSKVSPYMWFNPNQEGMEYSDVNTMAKVIDLSLISDIKNYMDIAEYIRTQAGKSVGITDTVEGQIGPREAVRNTQQNLTQTSNILEPYYNLHNQVKRNVLQALLETAKIAYTNSNKKKLSYFLDDMSRELINIDLGLLNATTIGVFLDDTGKVEEMKETIANLTHAAMQSSKIELSDAISILKEEGLIEAEESLKVAEQERREQEQATQQQQIKAQSEEGEKIRERERERHEEEKELIILKEEERRKTVITQTAITGASFNPDEDKNNNGINDFIEIAKHGLTEKTHERKNSLERDKLDHKKVTDKRKLDQNDKKLENDKEKIRVTKSKNTKK